MTQHHWKNIRGLGDREDELAGTGGEKPRKLGHLTYRNGKPVPGLCYCDLYGAHPAEPRQEGEPKAGLPAVVVLG